MPDLKTIRRRIESVKKTQQITSAMRMVAAAKLRRAQDAILAARPYAEQMRTTLGEVARSQKDAEHPLLQGREKVRRVEYLVVCSDRGLCGAFNANILKESHARIEEDAASLEDVALTLVGRKSVEFFNRRRPQQVSRSFTGIPRVEYSHAAEIAAHVMDRYLAEEVDRVILIHNEFVSALTQRPRVVPLLPQAAEDDRDLRRVALPYVVEPDPESLLTVLAPKAVEVEVFRALLESQAGEHAARMTAMESATRNTEELIDSLSLQYNRARQAAITRELVEIVSGAEAL